MLEIKFVRQNLETVQQALQNRGATADWQAFIDADNHRKTTLGEIEELRHRRNTVSDQIAALKKAGQDAQSMVTQMREVGDRVKELEKELALYEEKLQSILMGIPNIPH